MRMLWNRYRETWLLIIAVAAAFIVSWLTLPSAGFAASLPVAFVGGILIGRFLPKKTRGSYYASLVIMVCALHAFLSYGVGRGVVMALLALASSLLAVLVVRAVKTMKAYRDTDKSNVYRAAAVGIAAMIGGAAIWVFGTGDCVRYFPARQRNLSYIGNVYGTLVTPERTFYSPLDGCYLTETSYADAPDGRKYIASKDGTTAVRDDYRDDYLAQILPDMIGYYSRAFAYRTDTMEIRFPKTMNFPALTPHDDFTSYLPHAVCLIRLNDIIGDRDDFLSAYNYGLGGKEGYLYGYERGSVVYDTVILSAANAGTDVYYFAVRHKDEETVFIEDGGDYRRELTKVYGFDF